MSLLRPLTLVSLLLAGPVAVAGDRHRELVMELIEAQGTRAAMEAQLQQGKDAMKAYAGKLREQAAGNFGGQEPAALRKAYSAMLLRIENVVTVDEMIDTLAASYGSTLTDDEIEQMIAYYRSDIGRKDVAAAGTASAAYQAWLADTSRERAEEVFGDFVEKVKKMRDAGVR